MISAKYIVWTISSRAEQNVADGVKGGESVNDAGGGYGFPGGAVCMWELIHNIIVKDTSKLFPPTPRLLPVSQWLRA
jgi:hypothetical protein